MVYWKLLKPIHVIPFMMIFCSFGCVWGLSLLLMEYILQPVNNKGTLVKTFLSPRCTVPKGAPHVKAKKEPIKTRTPYNCKKDVLPTRKRLINLSDRPRQVEQVNRSSRSEVAWRMSALHPRQHTSQKIEYCDVYWVQLPLGIDNSFTFALIMSLHFLFWRNSVDIITLWRDMNRSVFIPHSYKHE